MRIIKLAVVLSFVLAGNGINAQAQNRKVNIGENSVVVTGPEGTTEVHGINALDANELGQRAGSAAKRAGEFGQGIAKAYGVKPPEDLEGEYTSKPGRFLISIGRSDGTAATYSSCTAVSILAGQTYNELGPSISFTGKVRFTTSSGENKQDAGSISLVRMAE